MITIIIVLFNNLFLVQYQSNEHKLIHEWSLHFTAMTDIILTDVYRIL